jgi:protein TonB
MFDDFSKTNDGASKKRMRRSMAAAAVIYSSSFGVLIAATATARHVAEEELTQIEFAPPPEPEPPPPEPEAPAPKPQLSPRPKARRPELAPPKEISDEKPKESDAPLAEAGEAGPVDGFLDGVEGGTGTAPAPAPPPPPPTAEKLTLPVEIKNDQPRYPKGAERKGIEGTVVVAFDVLENGSVANPKIVSGPQEFHEAVLETALKWRYRPAKRGDKPVKHRMTKRVVFKLEDA